MKIDRELDVRGLSCPLPILRAKKALSEMEEGQTLRVIATDTGSVRDFQAFCKQTGHELVAQATKAEVSGQEYEFVVRRK
ncbi:sulfurtransferase TusA family protein [Niveibacterium terrae]|uniref:sulfurtransferase TusA family protein n=1 Tax=Niveibacterium terrae TaxID=3373598 RepID=UPI003A9012C0